MRLSQYTETFMEQTDIIFECIEDIDALIGQRPRGQKQQRHLPELHHLTTHTEPFGAPSPEDTHT